MENPKAHLDFPCSLEEAASAPAVAEPLKLYHCCPTSDGAAVALFASGDDVPEYGAGGAPPEFVEQQARGGPYTSAVVALDGPEGGSVSVPTQVVAHDEPVSVGNRVEATIRRIYTQEGVIRYGFKIRPVGKP